MPKWKQKPTAEPTPQPEPAQAPLSASAGHAEKVVLALLKKHVNNTKFLASMGLVDNEDLSSANVTNLVEAAKLLFNMGYPVDTSTINDDDYTAWVAEQHTKAGQVNPPDARPDHAKGASLNSDGDEISDLEAADITPKTLEGLQSLGAQSLADCERYTRSQLLELPYVGGKAVDKLEAAMEAAGYSLSDTPSEPATQPTKPEPAPSEPAESEPAPADPTPAPRLPVPSLEASPRMSITIGHTLQPRQYESVKVEATLHLTDEEYQDLPGATAALQAYVDELIMAEMVKHN